ncbi:MAG TPA: hypothetical protein VFI53_03075 [Myxococcaceae bacterium]|nr:hypothetical protein [Myxococcaceae bacterium]
MTEVLIAEVPLGVVKSRFVTARDRRRSLDPRWAATSVGPQQ